MGLPRIYQPSSFILAGATLLEDKAAHHLINVLRLTAGDQFIVFNGEGGEYLVELISSHKKSARLKVIEYRETAAESPLKIHLAQGIARGEKMDFILQKAVELGISEFTPLFTERSNVKLPPDRAEKRLQHWQGVMIAACEQSGRTIIPRLNPPIAFSSWIKQTDAGLKLILHPHAQKRLSEVHLACSSINMVIGPEGGLSDGEITLAEQQGFLRLALGPRVLRTETAPLAAITLLQYLWGDMR